MWISTSTSISKLWKPKPSLRSNSFGRGFLQIRPGPFLAGILSAVDRSRLNGHDLVRVMQAEARMASHYEACKLASMVEVSLCPPGSPGDEVRRNSSQLEFADTEIAAALHQTRRSADDQQGLGWQLKDRLPGVWNALYAGRIDLARARIIVDATDHLPEETARKVVDETNPDGTANLVGLQMAPSGWGR